MTEMELCCPVCQSRRVEKSWPELICYACGHKEEAEDFPVSREWANYYSWKAGHGAIPGQGSPASPACVEREPVFFTLDELTAPVSSHEYQQLRAQMLNTQEKVNELYRKKKSKEKPY